MTKRSAEPIREVKTAQGIRYRVVVDAGTHPDGRRRQVTSTHRTKREARAKLSEIRADVARGSFVARDPETVDALLDRWLTGRRDVREVTLQGYRDVLVPARQRLGSQRVQDVTIHDVDRLVEWMGREGGKRGQGLSPRSIIATLGALSQALDLAEREGLVTRNVARLVKRPRQRPSVVTMWTADEAARFCAHVCTDRYAAAWLLSAYGLRRSEILGLRWADVDMEAGTVRIEQGRVAVTPTRDALDDPKSAQSRRVVPVGILPGIMAALRTLKTTQTTERLALGPGYDNRADLVVVDAVGQPPRPEWYSDRFRALCRAAGVPEIHLHATRHTAGSLLLNAGMPAVDVAAWLGHTTEVLHERYGRATAGGVSAVGAALGALYAAVAE